MVSSPLPEGRSGLKATHRACWLSLCQPPLVPSPETVLIHLRACEDPDSRGQWSRSLILTGPLGPWTEPNQPCWARLGWGRGWWAGLTFGWFLSVFLLNRYTDECVWDSDNAGGFGNKTGSWREPSFPTYLEKCFLSWVSPSSYRSPLRLHFCHSHTKSNFSHDSHVAACALLLLLNI